VFHGETVADTEKLEKSRDNLKHSVMSKKNKVLYPGHGLPSKEDGQVSGGKRTTIIPSEKPKPQTKKK